MSKKPKPQDDKNDKSSKSKNSKSSQARGKKGGRKKAKDTKPKEFGIGIGEMFSAGVSGFTSNAPILMLSGLPVFIVFGLASTPWRNFNGELTDRVAADPTASLSILEQLAWVGLLMAAAFPAGIVAAPWFRYALDVADGREINVMAPLIDGGKMLNHAFATFWFWAGIALGLRYSFLIPGLPSIVVLLLYPFYGYIIAGGREINGLKALGVSVRLGQGRRLGLFAIAGLFFMFNLVGVLGLGVGLDVETGSPSILGVVLGILGITATGSVTLVSGAAIYRVLEGKLNE